MEELGLTVTDFGMGGRGFRDVGPILIGHSEDRPDHWETWIVTLHIGILLGGFQHRVAWRIAGK